MSLKRIAMTTILRIPLFIWAIVVLYPILWMFLGAFKSNLEVFKNPWAWPDQFNFDHFVYAWTQFNIGASFFRSLFVTFLGTAICVILGVPTSYAIERMRFKGSRALFTLYISAMMIPQVLMWIPLFFLLQDLNMLNNLWALSVIYAIIQTPFTIFIICSFMGNVPKSLEEAAAIDGMSPYGILFKIVTPLVKTGIITASIMNAVIFWNEYFMALIFLQRNNSTLGVTLDLMSAKAAYTNQWGALFAGLCIAIIPIMIIYGVFQRYIVAGMTEGALKG